MVLLAGSTGYLGRHLLPRWVADSRISKIYCAAVRESSVTPGQRLFIHSEKLIFRSSDLALGLPSLGLADGELTALASELDLIIHSGANRSFWDNYKTLRASNGGPIKGARETGSFLERFRSIFLSSGAVRQYSSTTAPTDGYVASKMAGRKGTFECVLKCLSTSTNRVPATGK